MRSGSPAVWRRSARFRWRLESWYWVNDSASQRSGEDHDDRGDRARYPNDRLRALREEHGLSQKQAAEAVVALAADNGVYLGLNDRAWSRYERGQIRMPHPQVRWWIAKYFQTSPSALGFTSSSPKLVSVSRPEFRQRAIVRRDAMALHLAQP